jgi:hypothetical protein
VPEAVLYHKVGMSGDEHQHLIRGVAAGAVPKTWFRRRVSYHSNLVRFALKCLPPPVAARLVGHLVARAAWHLTHGNAKIAAAIALALVTNVRRLPSTWAARAEVNRTEVYGHAALMRRFAPAAAAEDAAAAAWPTTGRP